jgi:hypothetical protein
MEIPQCSTPHKCAWCSRGRNAQLCVHCGHAASDVISADYNNSNYILPQYRAPPQPGAIAWTCAACSCDTCTNNAIKAPDCKYCLTPRPPRDDFTNYTIPGNPHPTIKSEHPGSLHRATRTQQPWWKRLTPHLPGLISTTPDPRARRPTRHIQPDPPHTPPLSSISSAYQPFPSSNPTT